MGFYDGKPSVVVKLAGGGAGDREVPIWVSTSRFV